MTDNFAHRAAEWDSPEKIRMTELFTEEMLKHLSPQKSWKALEIGAGTGLVGMRVLPLVGHLVFEDTSAAMLEVLKQKLGDDHRAEILHGEVYEYNRSDLDLVFSCMAFHHIPDLEGTIAHLARITKLGATVVVGDLLSEDGSFHGFEPIPHKGFALPELEALFREAGFEVVFTRVYNSLKKVRKDGTSGEYPQFILGAAKK